MDKVIDRIYTKLQYLIPSLYSLALFRIILGVSLLYNLIIIRLPYVKEFYGKNTLIPKKMMIEMNGVYSFSILNIIQSDGFAYLLIWVTILAAIFFTIGYKTKIAGVVSLFGFWSLLQAGSKFAFGFDLYTFQVLFWGIFLPLGAELSVDSRMTKSFKKPSLSISLVLLIQITCIYFFTGLAKYGITWQNGTAIKAMLSDSFSVTPLSKIMINQTFLTKALTYFTLIFEILSPIMIFAKFKNQILRYLLIIILLGFHLTIFSMYNVANFSITGIAVAIFLIPNGFWYYLGCKNSFYQNISPTYKSSFYKYLAIIFCVFSSYIIIEKNIFFSTKHTLWKNNFSSAWVSNNLKFLDIPSPITISFFYQYWKMFAPNPPYYLGWFALEEKNRDDNFIDLFTNRQVQGEIYTYEKAWHPKGMERFLLYYSRYYKDAERGEKYRIYLFYWIINKLQEHGVSHKLDYKNYYLVNYIYKLNLENLDEMPTYKRDIKSCSKIIYGLE